MDAGGRDWAIAGVSLRSPEVAAQLNPQDGLYTVTERSDRSATTRVVGAVKEVLVAQQAPGRIADVLAEPSVKIATFTVTEKGYCRDEGGSLDAARADGETIYRHLAAGLRRRHDLGLPGLTLVSCDNLADNGPQLRRLLGEYLELHDPGLGQWFEAECTCPSTMVDRIVPATTPDQRKLCVGSVDLLDEGAVATEPFSQWVIEDRFVAARPCWERVGAQIVADVAPYETAKLRMLNGAHSALAYLGLQRGHTFVHEAIADPALRELVEGLMRREAAPTVDTAPGQDLGAYADALLGRFDNSALAHRLDQIAIDGSEKIPQRWLATLGDSAALGRDCPAIETALAAWLRHVRGDNGRVDDPRARMLRELWEECSAVQVVERLFGPGGPFHCDRRIPMNAWDRLAADLTAG